MSVQSTTKHPEPQRALHPQAPQDPQDNQTDPRSDPGSCPRPGRPLVPIPSTQARPPQLAWQVVERRQLCRRLSHGVDGFPLTLVCAPAGAGKTVLAADWAARRSRHEPVAWVSATERDEQPGVFWAHLRLSLAMAGAVANDAPRPMFPDAEDVDSLSEELLARTTPAVLVIDAAERLHLQPVFDQVARLIDNAAERLRVVMTTRVDPALPLHRYRLEGRLAEIRDDELALSRAEVGRLLSQGAPAVPADRVDEVMLRTEGWAAGVRLAALRLRSQEPGTTLDGFASDYLTREVLDRLSTEDRDLLARTSVAEDLPRGLAPALTGRPDADEVIRRLAASALVQPVAGRSDVLRVHPLLRELLATRLDQTEPGATDALHRRTAEWFADQSCMERAVHHAGSAGDWEYAATIVLDGRGLGEIVAGTPSGTTLSADLETMPEPGSDATRLLRAAVAFGTGELDRARGDLDRSGTGPRGRYALARDVLRAALHDAAARPEEALKAAQHARALLSPIAHSPGTRLLRAVTELTEGAAQLRIGGLEPACAALGEALAALADVRAPLRVRCLAELSLAEAGRGNLSRALRFADAADRAAVEQDLPPSARPSAIALARLWVALERQDLDQARRSLDEATHRRGAGADGLQLVEALLQTRLLRDVGDAGKARALLDRTDRPRGWLSGHLDAEAHALAASSAGPDGEAGTPDRSPAAAPGALGIPRRVQILLERADVRSRTDGMAAARADLARALTIAQHERVRRPFAHASQRVRVLVRSDAALSAKARWLRPQQLGGPLAAPSAVPETEPVRQALSGRELEVLKHLSALLTTDEIASEMFISVNTVRTHVRRILEKLSVTRRNEAVRRGRQLGLV